MKIRKVLRVLFHDTTVPVELSYPDILSSSDTYPKQRISRTNDAGDLALLQSFGKRLCRLDSVPVVNTGIFCSRKEGPFQKATN